MILYHAFLIFMLYYSVANSTNSNLFYRKSTSCYKFKTDLILFLACNFYQCVKTFTLCLKICGVVRWGQSQSYIWPISPHIIYVKFCVIAVLFKSTLFIVRVSDDTDQSPPPPTNKKKNRFKKPLKYTCTYFTVNQRQACSKLWRALLYYQTSEYFRIDA